MGDGRDIGEGGAGGVGQDDGGAAVGQRVFPFRLGGRQADRDLDRAGPPEAPLRGHVAGAGRGEEGDARFLQVVGAGLQVGLMAILNVFFYLDQRRIVLPYYADLTRSCADRC